MRPCFMAAAMRYAALALFAAILLGASYTYSSLHFAFSEGERVGVVQKMSKRGWVCKTNEGELAMSNVVGQPAQMFNFTVPDAAVATQVEQLAGAKVALKYEEHKGVPSSCFGDTSYYVVGVRKID